MFSLQFWVSLLNLQPWYKLMHKDDTFSCRKAGHRVRMVWDELFVSPSAWELRRTRIGERDCIYGELFLFGGKNNWPAGSFHLVLPQADLLWSEAEGISSRTPQLLSWDLPPPHRFWDPEGGGPSSSSDSDWVHKSTDFPELLSNKLRLRHAYSWSSGCRKSWRVGDRKVLFINWKAPVLWPFQLPRCLPAPAVSSLHPSGSAGEIFLQVLFWLSAEQRFVHLYQGLCWVLEFLRPVRYNVSGLPWLSSD